MHRAHQREYEKYKEDIESSKVTVQVLEKSSDAALNYKFYRSMKTYVENLINCLNEKVCIFSSLLFFFFFIQMIKMHSVNERWGGFVWKWRDTIQLKISSVRNFNVTGNKIAGKLSTFTWSDDQASIGMFAWAVVSARFCWMKTKCYWREFSAGLVMRVHWSCMRGGI